MSAYIVNDGHLNYLANFAKQKRIKVYTGNGTHIDAYEEPQKVIDVLYRENERSVNCRYREAKSNQPPAFLYRPQNFDMVQVLKSIDCLDYQSCENDDYEKSIAAKIINSMRSHAIHTLPGYDKAVWGNPEPSIKVVA